jgi:hypothetical protein
MKHVKKEWAGILKELDELKTATLAESIP